MGFFGATQIVLKTEVLIVQTLYHDVVVVENWEGDF